MYQPVPYTSSILVKRDMLPSESSSTTLANEGEQEVTGLILGASAAIDNYTQINWSADNFTQRTYKVVVGPDGVATIYTNVPLINTLTAIDYRVPTLDPYTWTGVPIDGAVEIINSPIGSKIKLYGNYSRYRGTLQTRITATTGYTDYTAIPADVELACRRLVVWLYAQRTAPLGMMEVPGMLAPVPQQWPLHVRQLLQSYRRVTS